MCYCKPYYIGCTSHHAKFQILYWWYLVVFVALIVNALGLPCPPPFLGPTYHQVPSK